MSVLLYTSACMPEVEELDDACVEKAFNIADNGYGPHHEFSVINSTLNIINATASVADIPSIMNTTIFKDTTESLITNDTVGAVVHNLTASIITTDSGSKTLGYTKSRILKAIVSYDSSSSSFLSRPTTAATTSSSTTTSVRTEMGSPDLISTLNNSSSASTVEYLLQNIANVTAEINSDTLDLSDTPPFPSMDNGSSMIPHGEIRIKDFHTDRKILPTKVYQSTDIRQAHRKHIGSTSAAGGETPSPTTDSFVAGYLNLSTTFFDFVNDTASHSKDPTRGYNTLLLRLLQTTSASNTTTMATGHVDCSRTFILLSTELQKTEVRSCLPAVAF